MKKCWVGLLLVGATIGAGLVAPAVLAQGCRTVAPAAHHGHHAQATYAAAPLHHGYQGYEVLFLKQLVRPSYYGLYVDPAERPQRQEQAAESDLAAAVKALAGEVKSLKEQVGRRGEPQPAPEPEPAAGPRGHDPFAAGALRGDPLAAACASCHEAATARKDGGDLHLFDRGVPTANLTGSDEVLDAAIVAVIEGRMPKKKKLARGDKNAVLARLHELRGAPR